MANHPAVEAVRPPADGWLVGGAGALLAFAALAAVVARHGAGPLDHWLLTRAATLRGGPTTEVAQAVALLGSPPVILVVALAAAVGVYTQTRRLASPAVLLGATTATLMVVYLTKIAVQRARPHVAAQPGSGGIDFALDFSFPAGPITDSTVVYGLAALLLTAPLRRPAQRLAILAGTAVLALLIGLARVYLGDHWATDVVAGWLLAAAVIAAAYGIVGALMTKSPG